MFTLFRLCSPPHIRRPGALHDRTANVIPWVVKVRALHVSALQGEGLVEYLCSVLQELIMPRRSGASGLVGSSSSSGLPAWGSGFPFFRGHGKEASGSLAGSLPGTPMSGTLSRRTRCSPRRIPSHLPSLSSHLARYQSLLPRGLLASFGVEPKGDHTKEDNPVGLLPAAFTVQLNDRTWRDITKINPQYVKLRDEFPENVILSGENDDPPAYFRHVG